VCVACFAACRCCRAWRSRPSDKIRGCTAMPMLATHGEQRNLQKRSTSWKARKRDENADLRTLDTEHRTDTCAPSSQCANSPEQSVRLFLCDEVSTQTLVSQLRQLSANALTAAGTTKITCSFRRCAMHQMWPTVQLRRRKKKPKHDNPNFEYRKIAIAT